MGIYCVKSNTCNCKGNWSTLTNDHRIYMVKPCSNHILKEGNTIYYELFHVLDKIIKTKDGLRIKQKYPVKILKIEQLDRSCKIIKLEVNHNGELNVDNFDNTQQAYFSQMNDDPMWKRIDDKKFEFILLYLNVHHTIEDKWHPEDY